MALPRQFGTNIAEQSTIIGIGDYVLDGALMGYRSFLSAGFVTGDQPFYAVKNLKETKYEYNRRSTYNSATLTLTRNVWLSSSSNGPVSWTQSDLPLIVYIPTTGELVEGLTRGFLNGVRTPILDFGLWFKQDQPSIGIHQLNIFDGIEDVPFLQVNTNTHTISFLAGSDNTASVFIGPNPPATPFPNQLWWNSEVGNLFVYYNDGNTTQWVAAVPGGEGDSDDTVYAPIDSPGFIGTPTAPTPPPGDNDTSLATTAFVAAAIAASGGGTGSIPAKSIAYGSGTSGTQPIKGDVAELSWDEVNNLLTMAAGTQPIILGKWGTNPAFGMISFNGISTGTINGLLGTSSDANLYLYSPGNIVMRPSGSSTTQISFATAGMIPGTDNTVSLGDATHRWSDFRAVLGAFSGIVSGPTATAGTSTTQLATTAFVTTADNLKQNTSQKSQPNGYASLDATGKVPTAELPSYVDDVVTYPDLASFPATGETGKIYVAEDTNLAYRWTGSAYVMVGGSGTASDYVNVTGDTMTGLLILSGDPSNVLGAATKQYVDLRALIASPTFTGDPKAPTPATADNDTSIATTAFVKAQGYVTSSGVTSVSGTAPVVSSGGVTPAISMAAATTSVPGYLTAADWTTFNAKAPTASPTFTGTPAAPTATAGTNTTQIATTAFVAAAISAAPQGTLTGITAGAGITVSGTAPSPTVAISNAITAGGPIGSATVAPIITYNAQGQLTAVTSATITPAIGSITGLGTGVGTFLATPSSANLAAALTDESGTGTVVFSSTLSTYAPLASPTFTGVPAAPTAAPATNTTQIATTAYVMAAIAAGGSYLPISGGTMTGTINAQDILPKTTRIYGFGSTANTWTQGTFQKLNLSDAVQTTRAITWLTNTSNRWSLQMDQQTEPGANAGGDLYLVNYADAGTQLLTPFKIRRSDGQFTKYGATDGVFSVLFAGAAGNKGIRFTHNAGDSTIEGTDAAGSTLTILKLGGTETHALTPAAADNTTKIATTAWVTSKGYVTSSGVTSVTGTAPVVSSGGATPAISMAAATTSVPGYLTAADWTTFNAKAPIASPTFTGTPAAPTATAGTNTTQIATTAFVTTALGGVVYPAKAILYGSGTSGNNIAKGDAADLSWDEVNNTLTVAAGTTSSIGIGKFSNALFNQITLNNTTVQGLVGGADSNLYIYTQTSGSFNFRNTGDIAAITTSSLRAALTTAPPAGGTLGTGLMLSNITNFGIMFGSGAPDKAAPRGTIQLRSDGTGAPYYNTDGTASGWQQIGSGGGSVTVGLTPPGSPVAGQQWFYTDGTVGGGRMYIYYNDGNTSQWIPSDASASLAPTNQPAARFEVTSNWAWGVTNPLPIPIDRTVFNDGAGTFSTTGGYNNNHIWTPGAGTWRISVQVGMFAGTQNAGSVYLMKNATGPAVGTIVGFWSGYWWATINVGAQITADVKMAAGDTLQVQIGIGGSSGTYTGLGGGYTFLSGHRIAS